MAELIQSVAEEALVVAWGTFPSIWGGEDGGDVDPKKKFGRQFLKKKFEIFFRF